MKLLAMAQRPLAAAMVGKTIGRTINEGMIPVYVERFSSTVEENFVTAVDLKHELGADTFKEIPTGALGLYTYFERLAPGLRQLMTGNRKFTLDHIERDDIASLTNEVEKILVI